jgi:hypothetical protein
MREAVGVAYRSHVAGNTSLGFPELAGESKQRMDKHFPVANNIRLSLVKRRASRRYCTLRRTGLAARGASAMGRKGSSADRVPPK